MQPRFAQNTGKHTLGECGKWVDIRKEVFEKRNTNFMRKYLSKPSLDTSQQSGSGIQNQHFG
jgi:hypothetical protein